jgi:hypothetical protein
MTLGDTALACSGPIHVKVKPFLFNMFKINENGCSIMITTTVMAEGIDYSNMQNVFKINEAFKPFLFNM